MTDVSTQNQMAIGIITNRIDGLKEILDTVWVIVVMIMIVLA